MNDQENSFKNPAKKITSSDLDFLADKRLPNGTLVFSGKHDVRTNVFSDSLIRSPFSRRECVYFRAEGYFETEDANFHVGTTISKRKFYILVKGFLVEVDLVKTKFPPTFVKKAFVSQKKNEVIETAIRLWNISPSSIGRELTIYEWCIFPNKEYLVRIEKHGSTLPPKEDRIPEVVTSHHFIFKDPESSVSSEENTEERGSIFSAYIPLLLSKDLEVRSSAIRELIVIDHGLKEELYDRLQTEDPKLLEAIFEVLEGKGEMGLKFLWQDKSGSVYRPFFIRDISDKLKIRYFLYKLTCDLSSSELACVISELGRLKAIESILAIIKVAEKSSLDCIIAATKVFGDLKASDALDFLSRCLSPGFLESKVRSPFDESKVDEARKMVIWAIKEIKKSNPESS